MPIRNSSFDKIQLREFVYLDEVSLRSLLVSVRSTVPESETLQTSRAETAEMNVTVGGNLGTPDKTAGINSSLNSKFQTTNSQSKQTTRKAIVQTFFKELKSSKHTRLVISEETVKPPQRPKWQFWKRPISHPRVTLDALKRGQLIEIEVELSVDPIFKFTAGGELMSKAMSGSDESLIKTAQDVFRAMLAGLIPIRAKATELVAVQKEGEYQVVAKGALSEGEESVPLFLVGVTEHSNYWKDIRRVLFSRATYTVLARIGKSGLQDEWKASKLADIFDFIPPIADALESVERMEFLNEAGTQTGAGSSSSTSLEARLVAAMTAYTYRLSSSTTVTPRELSVQISSIAENHKNLSMPENWIHLIPLWDTRMMVLIRRNFLT